MVKERFTQSLKPPKDNGAPRAPHPVKMRTSTLTRPDEVPQNIGRPPLGKERKIPLTATVTMPVEAAFRAAAIKRGRSFSSLVQDALQAYLPQLEK